MLLHEHLRQSVPRRAFKKRCGLLGLNRKPERFKDRHVSRFSDRIECQCRCTSRLANALKFLNKSSSYAMPTEFWVHTQFKKRNTITSKVVLHGRYNAIVRRCDQTLQSIGDGCALLDGRRNWTIDLA